jgi:hypothetical protein
MANEIGWEGVNPIGLRARAKRRGTISEGGFLGEITLPLVPMPLRWPTTLPCQPVLGSLTITPEPNVAEFKPDVGGPIRRQRYTSQRYIYSGTLQCTPEQKRILDEFYRVNTRAGSLTFLMKDWDEPSQERSFTFEQAPSFPRTIGQVWMVPVVLGREAL